MVTLLHPRSDESVSSDSDATALLRNASTKILMYAIAFDLDIDILKASYGDPYNNAYGEIRKILTELGFSWTQGSVYFGGQNINAVTCVLAAQELAKKLPWFSASVRDIRMLRIEELNDLLPAVAPPPSGPRRSSK